MRKLMKLVGLTIMLGLYSASNATETPSSTDIRCLIVGLRLGDAPNEERRSAGNLLAWYYLGRLEKVSPRDIEDAAIKELSIMTPAEFNSEASRCATVLREKSGLMREVEGTLTRHIKD